MLACLLALPLKHVGAVGIMDRIMDTHPGSFLQNTGTGGSLSSLSPAGVSQAAVWTVGFTKAQKDQVKVNSSFFPSLIKPFLSQPMKFLFLCFLSWAAAQFLSDTRVDVPAQLWYSAHCSSPHSKHFSHSDQELYIFITVHMTNIVQRETRLKKKTP